MNKIVTTEYTDKGKTKKVEVIVWNGRSVWFSPHKNQNSFIENNKNFLTEGIDYEILTGTKLKEFKNLVVDTIENLTSEFMNLSSLPIFYDSGLFFYIFDSKNKELKNAVVKILASVSRIEDNKDDKLETITKALRAANTAALLVTRLYTSLEVDKNLIISIIKGIYDKVGIELLSPTKDSDIDKLVETLRKTGCPVEEKEETKTQEKDQEETKEEKVNDPGLDRDNWFSLHDIARMIGIRVASSDNYAIQAISAILRSYLKVNPEDKRTSLIYSIENEHNITCSYYSKKILNDIKKWIYSNRYPTSIKDKKTNKNFKVKYE